MKSHESLLPTYIKNMLLVVMAVNSKGKQWKISMICTYNTMLLLADVISKFTNSSLNIMDCVWDIVWVHQLNMRKVDFELIWDADIYSLH